MKRNLVSVGAAALMMAVMTVPAYAQGGDDDSMSSRNAAESVLRKTTQTVTNAVDDTIKSATDDAKATTTSVKTLREQIEAKRAELKNEIQQKLDSRKQKLEGRRLAQCENRQASINNLLSKSAQIGQDRLTLIKDFETRAMDFAAKKNLANADIDAAKEAADSAEAVATAAIDVMSSTTFDCSMIDGANPTESIKTTREAKHTALKDYRAAVVHLIQVIKSAFSAQQASEDTGAQS
jgi:hypothetical protein